MVCERNVSGLIYKTTGSCHGRPCPECGSTDFTVDELRCEMICARCGAVIDDKFIQYSPNGR